MTRFKRLEDACRAVGLYVATWSPGDGVTRYRFFDRPGNSYFGPGDGIATVLGYGAAVRYARARGAAL